MVLCCENGKEISLIMLRRILVIMISFALFSSFNAAVSNAAEEEQYYDVIKTIAPYAVQNENDKISRGDCITAIMKLVGVDKEIADEYGDSYYYEPVFDDVYGHGPENDGYIFIAKYSDVATGVGRNYFEPDRDVIVQECLTFMLRCLEDPENVSWENVTTDSVQIGLLQKAESDSLVADVSLLGKDFCTLLYRMLNMNRYLYWPIEEPPAGHTKEMQIDTTNSIRYFDWFKEVEMYL